MRTYRATIHVNFINLDKKSYNKLVRLYLIKLSKAMLSQSRVIAKGKRIREVGRLVA